MNLESVFEWSASLTGVFAAIAVAMNAGSKVTGAGFVVFTFSSVCWIIAALMQKETPLALQNGVLFIINCVGIYRYLIRPAVSAGKGAPAE